MTTQNLLFALLVTFCSSCAVSPAIAPPPEDLTLQGTELYVSRSNLKNTEFEQYKIVDSKLFWECGVVVRNRPLSQQEMFQPLPPETIAELTKSVWEALNANSTVSYELDSPGSNQYFFDPGKFLLTAKTSSGALSVNTSLDSVTLASGPKEKRLLKIAEILRKASGSGPCGRPHFYGLGEKKKNKLSISDIP